MNVTGDQLGELGEHYVLHTGCPFFLGLDIFCGINCGMIAFVDVNQDLNLKFSE